MKRLIFILVVLAGFHNTLFAQTEKFKVNETRSKDLSFKGESIVSVEKMSDGNMLVLGQKFTKRRYSSSKASYLAILSSDLTVKSQKMLTMSVHNRRLNYTKLMKTGNKYVLFFTFKNQKRAKEYLFFVQVDPSDLTWVDSPKKLGEIAYHKNKRYTSGYFDLAYSENNKFIIITGIEPYFQSSKKSKFSADDVVKREFSFWLLNDKLNVVNHRKNYKVESKSGANIYMKRFKCDQEGNVYIVAENEKIRSMRISEARKKGKNSLTELENLNYYIIKLPMEEEEDIEFETDPGLLLVDLNIGFSPDGKYVDAVGILYEEVSGNEAATGVHAIRLNKGNLEEVEGFSHQFEEQFLKKINADVLKSAKKSASKKKTKKGKSAGKKRVAFYENAISGLTCVMDVLYNKDGNVIALLERQWLEIVTKTRTNSDGSTTTTTYYIWHYGDIVIAAGLESESGEPEYRYISKDDFSQIRYLKGAEVKSNGDGGIYIFAQKSMFKLNTETLDYSTYKIKATGGMLSSKSKLGAANGSYSNSIFHDKFSLNNTQFLGVQYKSRKKLLIVMLTAA